MSNVYKNIDDLCNEHGITGYKMCKQLGMYPSFMTDLRKGRKTTISAETAVKIAEYFGVSVNRIMYGTDVDAEKKTTAKSNSLTKEQRKLIELIKEMPEEEFSKKLPVIQSILKMK